MNNSPLKDNSNVKENEYNNGHTERQTVCSNPPELSPIKVSVFENYYATEPLGYVDLMKWFKTAKFKEQIIAFRTTSDERLRLLFRMAPERRESRNRFRRNLYGDTPLRVLFA